jgi:hypothetical protein
MVYRLQEEAKAFAGPKTGADSPRAKWMSLEGR